MPSFDLKQPHTSPVFDLIVGNADSGVSHELYGITSRGKDFIAYLQEVDDVLALGNWTCRILRRDFEAYGFDLARGRGLRLGSYLHQDDAVLVQELNQIPD